MYYVRTNINVCCLRKSSISHHADAYMYIYINMYIPPPLPPSPPSHLSLRGRAEVRGGAELQGEAAATSRGRGHAAAIVNDILVGMPILINQMRYASIFQPNPHDN